MTKAFILFGVFYFLFWTPFAQGKSIWNDSSTPLKNFTITIPERTNGTEFEYKVKGESVAVQNDETFEHVEEYEKPDETPDGKYFSNSGDITLEHIDYVQARLNDIARRTTSNINQLREVQKSEFEVNEEYKDAWDEAAKIFYTSKKYQILEGLPHNSLVRKLPYEYHIALIAYSDTLYNDFNKETRQVCSGHNVDDYQYKSYFKLLILAIDALGKEQKFGSGSKVLYRGVGGSFALEVNQTLAFQQFLSTSSSLYVALKFIEETLFEVHGDFSSSAVSLKTHSVYGHEHEVFVSPFEIYRVKSKHKELYYTKYVLVKHIVQVHPVHGKSTSTPVKQYSSNSASTIYNKNYILVVFVIILLLK